jgi:hypothetical protein
LLGEAIALAVPQQSVNVAGQVQGSTPGIVQGGRVSHCAAIDTSMFRIMLLNSLAAVNR